MLDGTAVDEIMKSGGWETESIVQYYIPVPPLAEKGSVPREHVEGATRARATCHCRLSSRNILQLVHETINAKKVWGRQQMCAGPVVNYEDNTTAYGSMGGTTGRYRRPHKNQALKLNVLR